MPFFFLDLKSEPKVRSFLHYFYDILPPLRRTLRTTPRSLPNHEGYYSFKNMVMNTRADFPHVRALYAAAYESIERAICNGEAVGL